MRKDINILIPLEEAIYYLEEVLHDSVRVLKCQTSRAPLLAEWRIRVNNALSIIYGEESIQNQEFCAVRFGSGSFTGGKDRAELVSGIRTALCKLRAYAEDLKRAFSMNQFSRDCFVAMWFDASMDETYRVGICAPLKDMGYNPVRIDKKEHNSRIDQQIFDEIRKSRFLISDITGHRGGVYYESGFASGLGLPVIQTCKERDFKDRHFDVFTINTIVYKTDEELATRLRQRVLETIGSI